MFKVTITSSRSGTDVQFFTRSNELNNYITQLMIDKKCLKEVRSMSPDKLTFTYQTLWNSEESYNDFRSNELVVNYNVDRVAHNLSNSITSETHKEHLP